MTFNKTLSWALESQHASDDILVDGIPVMRNPRWLALSRGGAREPRQEPPPRAHAPPRRAGLLCGEGDHPGGGAQVQVRLYLYSVPPVCVRAASRWGDGLEEHRCKLDNNPGFLKAPPPGFQKFDCV